MSLRTTPLHTLTPARLLHVIASYVLASADAFLSSACHCEPVRTLVRQSASPQRNSANWLLFGQIRCALPIRPKYCSPSCSAARRTDCHVAPLLAMTCRRQQRVCGGSSVVPGEFAALFRIRLRHCSLLCPTAGDADCPVASLLAMTCRRRSAVRAYKDAPRNDMPKAVSCTRLQGRSSQ